MKQPPGSTSSHQELVAACRSYLTWCGAWSFKVLGGLGQRPGMPDLLAAFPPDGRMGAVECKTGTATLSPAQRAEREQMADRGVVYVTVRELEDLEAGLIRGGLLQSPRLADWAGARDVGHRRRSAR